MKNVAVYVITSQKKLKIRLNEKIKNDLIPLFDRKTKYTDYNESINM